MARNPATQRAKTIGVFGNFGTGNFGNEYTLQAMLDQARKRMAGGEIACICSAPDVTADTYHVTSFPIRLALVRGTRSHRGRLARIVKKLLIGVPTEVYRWIAGFRTVLRTDMIVLTGTGMFSDFGISPFGLHYDILRWSLIARLCRRRLMVVSVGVGPIHRRLSRWFVKAALGLAHYRSYRDDFSKAYLRSIGFDERADLVYPDLAFSLPLPAVASSDAASHRRRVVALGVMAYYDKKGTGEYGDRIYRRYIDTLADFAVWLISNGYAVRPIIGDATYDGDALRDLVAAIGRRGFGQNDGFLVEAAAASVEDVLLQLRRSDLVVSSRFHNLVLALMLNKPVVGISYHQKVDELLRAFGFQDFCQDIDQVDLATLRSQFVELERREPALKSSIAHIATMYRRALDHQYEQVFGPAEA